MNDAEHLAKVATYGGASTAFFCGLSASEFAAIGGLVIGFIGLCANVWFQWRRDVRERLAMEEED